jgi:ABC-2 type transport system permease protein
MTLPETPSSAIYDLGYRGYEGIRLGRRAALWALFTSSLRQIFGLGRAGRAKIVPFGALALISLPAVIQSAVVATAGPVAARTGFTYDSYLFNMSIIAVFFTAAQAPELLGGDQRYHVLALYFSHALERVDYAVAKAGAMFAGLLALTVVPLLILFIGLSFGSTDLFRSLGNQIDALPSILVTGAVYAAIYGAIGLAIAAFTPRRAYATAAIVAVFLIGIGLQGLLRRASAGLGDWPVLLGAPSVAEGVRHGLFGGKANGPVATASLPDVAYFAWAAAIVVVGFGIYLWRYQRLQA